MLANTVTWLFILLWVITLGLFLLYLTGHRKRQRNTLEKYLSERDKSYYALKKSEERYDKLITYMNEGLIFTDNKDIIRFANKCACNILKINPGNIVNRPMLDFVLSPADAKKLGLPYELKKPGSSHREEMQLVRGNGEIFWAGLNISYMDALHELMPGSIIVMTDITYQKRAEEKLHSITISLNQRVKQLDCLFELSDITQLPGISLEEVLQKSIEVIPFGMKYAGDIWVEINLDKKHYRSKNFKETNLFYMAPIKGSNHKLGSLRVGYLGNKLIQDKDIFQINEKVLIKNLADKLARVIEMKRLESSLEEGLKKLHEIQHIARIGSWELDLVHQQVKYTESFFDVMGVAPDRRAAYAPDFFYKQVHPQDRTRIMDFEKKIFSGELNDLSHAYRITTDLGHTRYIFGNGRLIYNNQNKPSLIIGTIQDFTGQIHKFKDLQQ